MNFKDSDLELLNRVFEQGQNEVGMVQNTCSAVFKMGYATVELNEMLRKMGDLSKALQRPFKTSSTEFEIKDDLLPLLKMCAISARRNMAEEVESHASFTNSPTLREQLDKRLAPHDGLTKEHWFRKTEATRMPRLSDFLTMEQIEKVGNRALAPRQYDEKFHLHQSPSLLLKDIDHYRQECGLRNSEVGVVFLDIDKFKDVNSEFGETTVDRLILPVFMLALESTVFAHGHVYRQGGDEYTMVLPNADRAFMLTKLEKLRHNLASLKYANTPKKLTVSIGFVNANERCWLTNSELLQRAERAKNFAKAQGRDRVATYKSETMAEEELEIVLATSSD